MPRRSGIYTKNTIMIHKCLFSRIDEENEMILCSLNSKQKQVIFILIPRPFVEVDAPFVDII